MCAKPFPFADHSHSLINSLLMNIPASRVLSFLLIVALIAGCSSGSETDPPGGWSAEEDRWWAEGVDTSTAFRSLDSLEAMGISTDETMAASLEQINPDQLAQAVKNELIALYRNQPEIVDSLFEEYARPDLEEAEPGEDMELADFVQQQTNESYKAITEHFQEPQQGEQDLSITYPDSLRSEETSGAVSMQLYLDEEGTPQAVELLEGVHPVLNAIAMRAATQTEWEPAYVMEDGDWQAIPSWARFGFTFQPPPGT